MSYYQSVSAWLKEIRAYAEHYEPLAFVTYAEPPLEKEDDVVVERYDLGMDEEDVETGPLNENSYVNIWDCRELPVKFGRVQCVSVIFSEESVDDLKTVPVVYESVEWEVSEDVMNWRNELRFERVEEDSVLETKEFINSIKIDDEGSHSFPKQPKFPVLDDVVIRKKTQPNTVRAKTLNCDLTGLTLGRLNEIKGVTKIVIGDELCAKITKQEKLVFEDNEIHIIGRSGQDKMLKDQIELRPGIQQLDKKNVVLRDVNNVPIQLLFDTSKDAKCFVESERLNSPLSEKTTIRSKLLRLLGKRSSKEFLMEKGIYMNETIFGNTIQSIYQMQDRVPEFLTRSIQLIEMPNNISQVGIYRTSGNLATIQKIRFEVDKGNLSVLDQYYEDVDVLTGALKLFFRELKEPLIPLDTSEELLAASDKPPSHINAIVRKLPKPNYETLMCLLGHLLNIVNHKEENKMDIYNLTICWGPSLMFVPDNCMDIMAQSSNNSKVLDLLLNYYKDYPKDLSSSLEHIDAKSRSEARTLKELEPIKGHKKSSSSSSINDVTNEVVTKLIDLIEANVKIEGLYKKPGSQVKIDKITKKLTKGKLNEIEKLKADIHDFAGALRKYISDLSEPLIPKGVYEELNCDDYNHSILKMRLKKGLDTVKRKETLTILLRHMAHVLNEEKSNKTTLQDVCSYWRNTLFKTDQHEKFKTKLLEILLESYWDHKVAPHEVRNPMPDVIKDIEAMGRFSKYENVNLMPHGKHEKSSVKGEAKILEEKTETDDEERK